MNNMVNKTWEKKFLPTLSNYWDCSPQGQQKKKKIINLLSEWGVLKAENLFAWLEPYFKQEHKKGKKEGFCEAYKLLSKDLKCINCKIKVGE